MPVRRLSGASSAAARAQSERHNAMQAQLAQEQLAGRRRQAAVRHSRERKRNIIRAVVSGGLLGLLLALGIYLDVVPMLGQSAVSVRPGAASRFSDTRTGQVLFVPLEGNSCRQLLFNNETGKFREVGQVACNAAQAQEAPAQTRTTSSGDRLDSIRDAFNR